MDCPSCGSCFNENDCIPRIVVKCGHSLCIKCLQILIKGAGMCPTCKQVELNLTSKEYPVNYSLLTIL